MADPNYGYMTRGGLWPEGGAVLTIALTRSTGWAGAAAWTWTLRISRDRLGGTPDLTLTSASAVVVSTVMTLTFVATAAETDSLPETGRYYVQVHSKTGIATSFYHDTLGKLEVVDGVGQTP